MALYDIKGNPISGSGASAKKGIPSPYNFSAITSMIEKNASVTPKAEFKSDDVLGDKMYCGGICSNNKIYFAPNTADSVMVYDTVNDYIYFIGQGLGNFPFKYTGMVEYNGYLYCVPRGVNNFVRINPLTDEVSIIELETNYPVNKYSGDANYQNSHHYNGCISDEGFLYSPPAYSSKVLLKVNMNDFTFTELDFTCEHSTTWTGCVRIPDNKIVFLGNKGFRVWDCSTDTVIADINAGGSLGIYDMAFDPRDNCLYAYGSNKFVKLDTTDYTYSYLGWVNNCQNTYGTVLGIDGRFYSIGMAGHVYAEPNTCVPNAIVSSDCVTDGMTVCSAGMVLANDGSIYSVPGNGRLIKVSFEGATGRLPDYIVTGKYYGKY